MAAAMLGGRQLDTPALIQTPQGLRTAPDLQPASTVDQAELAASLDDNRRAGPLLTHGE